jgi:hypothetical protein
MILVNNINIAEQSILLSQAINLGIILIGILELREYIRQSPNQKMGFPLHLNFT